MRRAAKKRRASQLDREIAHSLASKRRPRSYHAAIRECAAWSPEATVEPLTEAKRQSTAAFERCYLVNLMQRAGSVSEAARLAGLDRANFRRLLTRYGLRARG